MSGIEIKGAKVLFRLGPFAVTQTVISLAVVTALLCTAGAILGRNLKKHPGKLQVLTEKGVQQLMDLVTSTMGAHNIGWVPYIGTLFLSSLAGSLISLTGFLRATTADLAVVLTWAVMTSLIVWYQTIKRKGFLGWLKGFAEPFAVMTPINILSELAQPIAMAFRHFGNIAGGSIITMIVYTALSAASGAVLKGVRIPLLQLGLPAVLSVYFDLFSGFIQAFVFSLLSMVYIGAACPPEK